MDESPSLDREMSASNKRQKKRHVITVRVGNDREITVDQDDYRAFCKLSPGLFPKISFKSGKYDKAIIGSSYNEEKRITYFTPFGSETGFSFGGRIPDALWTLSALTHLKLGSTSTGPIPPSIQLLSNLNFLDLAKNALTHLPPEIGHLVRLMYLHLKNNELEVLPAEIGNLVNLRQLHLKNNELKVLPQEIGNLVKLYFLDLENNKLERLPVEIGNLVNLNELNLENNKLEGLPAEIGNLVNLDELNLGQNYLEGLPAEIGNLVRLGCLHLNDNKLEDLPSEIGDLANLQVLYLHENRLEGLPPQIGKLATLKHLVLSDNNIEELPPEFGNLVNLDRLFLSNNLIGDLPSEIGNLIYLEMLLLYDNELEDLPPEIGNLVNLEVLDLRLNPLEFLPPSIGNLINLRTVYIESSELDEVPDELWNLPKLRVLDMQYTFVPISPSIERLQTLQTLSIDLVSKLPEEIGSLANLTYLKVVVLMEDSTVSFPSSLSNLQKLQRITFVHQCSSKFDFRQMAFIRKLPNISEFSYIDDTEENTADISDGEVELMTDIILDTPSLYSIKGTLLQFPGIKYAIACNRFKLRNPFSAGSNEKMLPFFGQLWPRMLTNACHAFEPSKLGAVDGVEIEPHEAVYKFLIDGRESFIQMLLARKPKRNITTVEMLLARKPKRNLVTMKVEDELITIDEEDLRTLSILFPNAFSDADPDDYDGRCLEIIEIQEDDEERRITTVDTNGEWIFEGWPEYVEKLSALKKLDLDNAFPGPIPSTIQSLQNLEYLSLEWNGLTHLPPEIGNLVNLKSLHVGCNRLVSLPPEIGNLGNLRTLNLPSNKLKSLPLEIGNLAKLESVDLSWNPLVSLPPSIGNLSNLEEFQMEDSPLEEVPEEFWNLSKLQRMKLQSTAIVIPPSIERLQNLCDLCMCLDDNLPEEFGNLAILESLNLNLWGDCTMPFPSSMTNLRSLRHFTFDFDLDGSSNFAWRQLAFLRKLPKLETLSLCNCQKYNPITLERIVEHITEDEVDFMKDLILDTPSLRNLHGFLFQYPKIKSALLHNRFKHRTSFGRETKDMSALVYKLWPQMLSNAARAFYPKEGKDDTGLLGDPHDAVFQLLIAGRGSFVGMLCDRNRGNLKESEH